MTLYVFYGLVALGIYTLAIVWWREARPNALLVPIVLASAQMILVVAATTLTEVIGHPDGPSAASLIALYWKGLLPIALMQMAFVGRRKPEVAQRLWRVRPAMAQQIWGWSMIVFLTQLTMALLSLSDWGAVDIACLALQVATLLALVAIQLGWIGPPPASPVAQAVE